MKTIINTLLFFLTLTNNAQVSNPEINYWIGSGSHKAYFVIDFNDGNHFDSYVWGYRFNDLNNPPTLKQMILDIADNDPNLSVSLIDPTTIAVIVNITYNDHNQTVIETGGVSYSWWSTWFGNSLATMNEEYTSDYPIIADYWYGASFNHNASIPPGTTFPALRPNVIDDSQFTWEVGTGEYFAYVSLNFAAFDSNYFTTWKVRYNSDSGNIISEQLMNKLVDTGILTAITVNPPDIIAYKWTYNGIDRYCYTDYYWFSGSNPTDQQPLNANDVIPHGGVLAISLGEYERASSIIYAPYQETSSIGSFETSFSVYPNPTTDFVNINTNSDIKQINIYDLTGRLISTQYSDKVGLQNNQQGIYILEIITGESKHTHKIIKH